MTSTAKTTKAPKAKLLRLTSRAKSPKRPARKAQAAPATQKAATDLKATLEAAVEAVTTAAPTGPGLDGDAKTPAAQIGEMVTPKVKAKAEAAKKAGPEAKTDHSATLLGLLRSASRASPREMMDATSLSHSGLKAAVGELLREKNLKVVLQRNPQPDPKDRTLTAYLYGVEPKA